MKYKLLVLDLDGTLTNNRKEITDRTRLSLIEAQKKGVKLVLASGRPTYGIVPLAEKLEMQRYEGYILAYNGGEIIDWKTRELMYKNVLDPEVLPYLYQCARIIILPSSATTENMCLRKIRKMNTCLRKHCLM